MTNSYTPDSEEVRIKYVLASGKTKEAHLEFDRWLARESAATLEDLAVMWERTAHLHGDAMNDADWEYLKLWCESVRVVAEHKYGSIRAEDTETGETS